MPPAHNRILFGSQRGVNNTDVTRITIYCQVDYYMINLSRWFQSYVHDYVNFSVFRSFFKIKGCSCFVNLSVVLSMVGFKNNLRAFGCNLRDTKYKKGICLRVFDL